MLRWCYARVGAIHTNEAAAGEESASSTTNVSSYLYTRIVVCPTMMMVAAVTVANNGKGKRWKSGCADELQ